MHVFLTELADSLCILSDAGYVPSIHKELLSGPEWVVRPLKTVAQLAWGLTLRALAQYSNNQGRSKSYGASVNIENFRYRLTFNSCELSLLTRPNTT